MDFGEVGLAGAFLKPEQFAAERTFPMRLHFCRDCYAVQVTDKVPADVMFRDYFYFSSSIGTLRDHFAEYAAEVTKRFLDPSFAVATRTQPAPARPDASLIIAQAEAAALEVYLTAHAM